MGHAVCHVLPTVPPATSVTFQPDREGRLYIGTPLNLVCAVTVDRTLVDTDIMVTYSYENFTSDTNRTRITTSESSFQGMAEFNFLLPSDCVAYGCVSTMTPVDSTPFVDPATNPTVTHTLELTGEPTSCNGDPTRNNYFLPLPQDLPPPNVTLDQSPIAATAGDDVTITCTVTVIDDLVVTPSLQWAAPGGTIINTGNPSSVTGEVGQVSTIALRFMPLHTSHGGEYSCIVTITIPGLSPINDAETSIVIVRSESPVDCADWHGPFYFSPHSLPSHAVPLLGRPDWDRRVSHYWDSGLPAGIGYTD